VTEGVTKSTPTDKAILLALFRSRFNSLHDRGATASFGLSHGDVLTGSWVAADLMRGLLGVAFAVSFPGFLPGTVLYT
jgi:hypothetical protein